MSKNNFITYTHFIWIVLLLTTSACIEAQDDKKNVETAAMIAILDSIAMHANPEANIYANNIRVKYFRNFAEPLEETANINYHGTLAYELLAAGETELAIEKLESILNSLEENKYNRPLLFTYYAEKTADMLALAYLRLGEQQNCIIKHTSDSCLFPIRDQGIHTLTNGSEKAIELYERILREWRPDDMEVRWLLNIAYMTLGKHPDDVPEQWLIPMDTFKSEYEIQRFPEIAPRTGLADDMMLLGGSITEDFNKNGYIDIMASSWGLNDQLHYYENNGNGTFTKRTKEAGLTGIVGGINLIHGDFNNNGFPDVYVMRGAWLGDAGQHPNSLLRNNGDGTFTDVTESAGLLSFRPTLSAVWADFNNNGWLDLFVGNQSGQTGINPAELYMNNKDGTFTNVANQAEAAMTGYIKGVTAGDFNNNGLQDLYISRLDGYNILLKNDGPDENGIPLFTDVTQQAGVEEPFKSFPVWFWDYNNDGWLDLFVSGYEASSADVAKEYLGMPHNGELPRLYKNNGDGTFTDVTVDVGLDKVLYTMGSNFGDLDNDGYPDFYAGTGDPDYRSLMPNRMFRNNNGERFEEVTVSGGFGHLQKGHGVSFADLNNNGNQDIFAVIGGALEGDVYMNALFHNPGYDNHWITLLFDGQESNRFGIGNRIKIDVETPQGNRTIHKVVTSGGSFGSSSLQKEIGLGDATSINRIEVFWPASGKNQTFENVPMRSYYLVSENSDQLKKIERTKFDFITDSFTAEGHQHHQ